MKTGVIGCRLGTLFAGTTEVDIDVLGKDGHAAFPQEANDAVVAAAALIMQVQTIISRSINPVEAGVITLGKLEAGTIRNVIAGHARIEGTIRGLTQEMIETIDRRLQDVCEGIAKSFGVTVNLALNLMQNNPAVDYVETAPAMTGEDFGYLLSKLPGTMFWLGVEDDAQLHQATLTPNEGAIQKGIDALTSFITYRSQAEED